MLGFSSSSMTKSILAPLGGGGGGGGGGDTRKEVT